MRHGGLLRPSSRGAVKVAVVATLLVAAAGLTAGSAAAVGQQAVSLQLSYGCQFRYGYQPVSAQVSGTFPAAATTGQPIKPTGTGITVSLPQAAVTALGLPEAGTVTLTAGLSTEVAGGTKPAATATWRQFGSPAAAIPRSGPLTLTTSGAAPAVTADGPGDVTVAAGALSLYFTAHPADAHPASTPAIQVACVPDAGQRLLLARIAVTGAPQRHAAASSGPGGNPAKCLPFPKNLTFNPQFPLPKPPPGSQETNSPEPGCAYAAGFTNQRKLNEAVLVGPGLTDFLLTDKNYDNYTHGYTYLQFQEPGELEYHGLPELPPARATVLGFGFTPVSATLQISEIGTINAALVGCTPGTQKCPNSPPSFALFFARVSLSISDVDVNGVPLNVGPHCQTVTPFTLELTGLPPAYNVSSQYGVLTGTVTVPFFKGCGVGEDLDPLFDLTVSGPGNFVKVTQAVFCTPTVPKPNGCPPALPVPKH